MPEFKDLRQLMARDPAKTVSSLLLVIAGVLATIVIAICAVAVMAGS